MVLRLAEELFGFKPTLEELRGLKSIGEAADLICERLGIQQETEPKPTTYEQVLQAVIQIAHEEFHVDPKKIIGATSFDDLHRLSGRSSGSMPLEEVTILMRADHMLDELHLDRDLQDILFEQDEDLDFGTISAGLMARTICQQLGIEIPS